MDGSIPEPSSEHAKPRPGSRSRRHLIYEIEDKRIAKICQTAGALPRPQKMLKIQQFPLIPAGFGKLCQLR
jgi:hypothetical protein